MTKVLMLGCWSARPDMFHPHVPTDLTLVDVNTNKLQYAYDQYVLVGHNESWFRLHIINSTAQKFLDESTEQYDEIHINVFNTTAYEDRLYDFIFAFIERCFELLSPGGSVVFTINTDVVGKVVPVYLFASFFASKIYEVRSYSTDDSINYKFTIIRGKS